MAIDEGLVEEIRACSGKKNSEKCMYKVMEEHGIEKEQMPTVLTQVINKMNEGEKHGERKQN